MPVQTGGFLSFSEELDSVVGSTLESSLQAMLSVTLAEHPSALRLSQFPIETYETSLR